jgi:uncharacterized surface protein with fasciclin (FAS1) repeats
MPSLIRPRLAAVVAALALSAAACGGQGGREPAPQGGEAPQGGGEQAATIDTTCQVALPGSGEGSAEGMTDDPVATAASNNPALSTLVQAVKQAGLVDTLNNLPAGTVFAPTNDAFNKIPPETLNAVLADKEQLTSILTLHVVPEQKLDAQALAGMDTVPTVNGQNITLAAEAGTLTTNGQAKVICPNVKTANATVHLIDTVMMPQS